MFQVTLGRTATGEVSHLECSDRLAAPVSHLFLALNTPDDLSEAKRNTCNGSEVSTGATPAV